MYNVTIARLTCFNLVTVIVPFFISAKARHPQSGLRVGYIDATAAALLCARMILALWGISVERIHFKFLDLVNGRGELFCFDVDYKYLQKIQDVITGSPFLKSIFTTKESVESNEYFFVKRAMVTSNYDDPYSMARAMVLIFVAGAWHKKYAEGSGQNILFIDAPLWQEALQACADDFNVKIKPLPYVDLKFKDSIVNALGEARLRYLLKPLNKLKGISTVEKPQQAGGIKLVLEYYGLLNLDQPQFYSNFMFMTQSSFPSQDVLLLSNMINAPLRDKDANDLQRRGIQAIALNPKATQTSRIPVFYYWTKDKRILVPQSFVGNADGRQKRFVYQARKEFNRLSEYYENFFKTFNGKIYLSWYKYDQRHAAISEAVKKAGGIMAMYQRSFEESYSPRTAVCCDVFFGFNKESAAIEECSGSKISQYVLTGYLGDHRFDLLKQPAALLRARLNKSGARKIAAFFDENSAPDERWNPGHAMMRENYRFLLEKVLSHNDFGLILKPKMHTNLRHRLGPVALLLDEAIKTGRCHLYASEGIYNHYPPVIAALSADIAIHGHLCAATAGLESALAGVPTLLLDREMWTSNKLYRLKEGKIIFRNWEHLWDTCSDHWKKPIDGFGDWSGHLRDFDPFCDGRASERMGTYLQWLLEGFKANMTRDENLSQAALKYTKQWGNDKIVTLVHAKEIV